MALYQFLLLLLQLLHFKKDQFYYFNSIISSGVVQNAIWTTSTSGLIDIRIMSSEFGNPDLYGTISSYNNVIFPAKN